MFEIQQVDAFRKFSFRKGDAAREAGLCIHDGARDAAERKFLVAKPEERRENLEGKTGNGVADSCSDIQRRRSSVAYRSGDFESGCYGGCPSACSCDPRTDCCVLFACVGK